MPVITAVTPSPRREGRFDILVDGRSVGTLSLEAIERLRLHIGTEYDERLAESVAVEAARLRTFDRALDMLAFRGRAIAVPQAAGRTARFSFTDLCEKPLGAADYLEILAHYDTLFVDHIPLLGAEKRNETKRFINLVDTIYDHRARLFASAAAAPEDLLVTRKGTEGFEFDRTVSRLIEIRSTEYLADHRARYGENMSAA